MIWLTARLAGWLSERSTLQGAVALLFFAVIAASLVAIGLDALNATVTDDRLLRFVTSTAVAVTVVSLPLLIDTIKRLDSSRRRLIEECELHQAAEQRFRDYVECSSDWLWETNEDHRFVWFSERYEEVVGVPAARRLGLRRIDLRTDDPADDDWDAHLDDLAHARPFRNFRYAFPDVSGRRHVVHVSGKPVFDVEGRFRGYRGTGHEITRQFEQEQALRDREGRLNKAQRVARLGDWRRDLKTGELVWSTELYRLFGVDPATFEPSPASFFALVHPDDREPVRAAIRRAGETRGPSEYEFRVCRPDGELRYFWTDAIAERDGAGNVVAYFGVCRDITEQKRTEIALRASEERFRQFAEASSDWLWEMDADLRFSYVSGRLREMAGIEPARLLGRRCHELVADSDGHHWHEQLADLEAHRPFRDFVYRHTGPEGSEHHLKISGLPVFDADGTFRGYRGTGSDITEQVRAEERVRHLAHHDGLTGLPNRTLFQDRLDQALAQAKRRDTRVALLQLDLDRFKDVNDTLGHLAGDALLREAGARLGQCVRASDTVARLGGDEFAIILTEIKSSTAAGQVAHKLVQALAEPVEFQGETIHTGTSIGITLYPSDGVDANHLLKNADIALYQAKEGGGGSYSFFIPEMKEQVERRKRIETDLREALGRDEFTLLYQPVVSLADFGPRGFEVLLRWQHPRRGEVSPAEFIAVADECGLTVSLGELVLRRACAQATRWLEDGLDPGRMAVNLATGQFRRGGLAESVQQILEETGLASRHLELEVTEDLLMERHRDAVYDAMFELHRTGVSFALDDFGTGYASLGHLKHFPIDRLKIDHGFVRNIGTDPDDAAIARAMINLGHSLDIEVVAEGVESEEQLDFLRLNGCDLAQGFHFAAPMPAADAEAFLVEASRRERVRAPL